MFLTLEDPRARIKGSRDPLGVQGLWVAFGRHVVGNLTTVTTSVRNFTVLLLGRHLAAELANDERIDETQVLSVFLRWEQVAGYVRELVHEAGGDIRGIERIRRTLGEGESTAPIGIDADSFILSDQKTYGLWGLYTVAARVSGLLPDGLVGVTPQARALLEHEERGLPRLGRQRAALLELLLEGGDLPLDPDDALVQAVAALLGPELAPVERAFYSEHLRDAASLPTTVARHQKTLASLMARHLDLDEWIGRPEVQHLAQVAEAVDAGLAHRLRRILVLEALLAPCQDLFDYLLARPRQPVEEVAAAVRSHWGPRIPHIDPDSLQEIGSEIADVTGTSLAGLLARAHEALRTGAYADAIRALVDWNTQVMAERRGAAWLAIEDGRLDVRYAGPEPLLPTADELATRWRNAYFLDSLRRITQKLEAPPA